MREAMESKNKNQKTSTKQVAISKRSILRTTGTLRRKQVSGVAAEPRVSFTVNGKSYELRIGDKSGDVAPSHTLAYTIRETIGLTGTKIACNEGACGACTVLMDGQSVLSCMLLTVECEGKNIVTIEGLEDPVTGKLHPLQQAFVNHTAFQCGFCTPGIIMSSKALLDQNPSPSEQEIKDALAGHFCRCISHYHVLEAVKEVIGKKGGETSGKRL
jgi:carbon-monoxide dehydrogenase small subunit